MDDIRNYHVHFQMATDDKQKKIVSSFSLCLAWLLSLYFLFYLDHFSNKHSIKSRIQAWIHFISFHRTISIDIRFPCIFERKALNSSHHSSFNGYYRQIKSTLTITLDCFHQNHLSWHTNTTFYRLMRDKISTYLS